MSSGGSSGRGAASGSRSFDFGADDILCSYDDFSAKDPSIGKRSDPPGKDLHESRMGRPLVSIYEQEDYSREGVISSVDKCMKKYADNLLRTLDGISGRLSQLEITCHKLDRSVCELRADFIQDQSEKDMKFKSLEKQLHEVHRSVQILRDKQELAETHKELAKLQLAQKESTEKNENAVVRSVSEPNGLAEKSDTANQQMTLSLPRQSTTTAVLPAATSQPIQSYKEVPIQHQAPNIQQDQITMNQVGNYYAQHQTMPQDQRSQPVQTELHYMQPRTQLQDRPIQVPPSQHQPSSFPQYQQHLPPQPDQQLPQQPTSQAQIRPQTPPSYPPYPSQPVNPSPETYPSSMPMQIPNPTTIPQPGGMRPDGLPFGYGGTGSSVSQPPLHHSMQQPIPPPVSQGSFGPPQLGKGGYITAAPYPQQLQNMPGYNAPYNYPSSNLPGARNQPMPPPGSSAAHHYDPQFIRNHPYGEMIEKAIGMGFDRNQVINVVQRMVESGQPMDFNSLLDRLNGHASGASARAW
ncbi:pollen-specific leucine-rich repeat extensin-like protein 3 isoform X3 [Canna indica]|uniref:Pollen-specific leucine-rich repeat extensin-like protein 3 isoform X3 n=1 Tax=Canna indica TaxID=4628 RepID=A0AAQ3L947_9LILI|nr:pollen-specific leucine-rich repeat extensin-like protein 3 isoform X3 [Canna indica]